MRCNSERVFYLVDCSSASLFDLLPQPHGFSALNETGTSRQTQACNPANENIRKLDGPSLIQMPSRLSIQPGEQLINRRVHGPTIGRSAWMTASLVNISLVFPRRGLVNIYLAFVLADAEGCQLLKPFEHINKLQTQGGGSSGYEWSLDRLMARDYGFDFRYQFAPQTHHCLPS